MDMAFDLDTAGKLRTDEAGRADCHPSWPELVARMAAARQASGSLGRALRAASNAGSGSFYDVAADILVAQAARRVSVNPNDLGNRKSDGATPPSVAGHTSAGGRGK
jgi:hypothetical protein